MQIRSRFFESIYLKFRYRNYTPKRYLSIVSIVKNETQYISEWIEYHLLVGVEKFYIYDNGSKDNLYNVLEKYIHQGIVEYKLFPGKRMQKRAYNNVLNIARKETFWLAAIDIDEFIVPVEKFKISDVLKDFECFGGVGINWIVYGSSGKDIKEQGLVMERFKDHSLLDFKENRHIKSIVNPRCVYYYNIHHAKYIMDKYCVNELKEKIKGPFSNISVSKLRINHYFSKSRQEYSEKILRGFAHHIGVRNWEHFDHHDKNDITNDTIMDKYIPIIKNKLMV